MRRRPIVVQQRRGPSLINTMARTAVIAGTATAVSGATSKAMHEGAQAKATQQQAVVDQAVQNALAQQQAEQDQLNAQMAAQPAAPAPASAASSQERIAALQQLAELHQQGILTAEEFAAEKARVLAS